MKISCIDDKDQFIVVLEIARKSLYISNSICKTNYFIYLSTYAKHELFLSNFKPASWQELAFSAG
jgi:hypothetical protein